ncbi:MAG TPA: Calx-beta domain-containing protein, partial [Fibrobacteria bacterium]|nr:Calx-beta domain-containing protein [Fibrobacteria bacterium]
MEPDLKNGRADTVELKFPITMDHINGLAVRVYYHTRRHTAGTAPADPGVDYLNTSGSIVIRPTFLSDTVRVKVVGDIVWEGNETIELVLDSVKNGNLGRTHADSVGVGTIIDNDPPPVLSFVKTQDTVVEGNSKALKVKMSFLIGRPLTVQYALVPAAGFTAIEGSDFQLFPTPKTLSFPALTDTASITVNAIDDPNYEYPERFQLRLFNSSIPEVLIDPVRGHDTVTILSNDPIPVLTINDTTLMEGQSALLRASLRGGIVSGDSACFDWKTIDSTALAGSDYVADSGHACIPAGQNSVVLKSLRTRTDAVYEQPEVFRVQLKPGFGLNATPDRFGRVTILNTNPRPTIRISDVTAKRPTTGTTVYTFRVRLVDTAGNSAVTGVNSTVSWKTLRGTAVPGLDYDSAAGSFTFSGTDPADSVKTVSVTVRGSSQYHATPLRFTVNLTTDMNIDTMVSRKKTVGVGTMTSAVGAPRISWVGDTVDEGSNGQRTAIRFTARLLDSLGNATTSRDPVVFVWSTQDSTARATSPDTHYVARANVVVAIPAGTGSKLDSVMVIGNDLYQDALRLLSGRIDHSHASATGYDKTSSANRALGGIRDADIAPLVASVVGPSLTEGNSGTKPFAFTVNLDRPSGKPVTFTWKTIPGGSATAGSDFVAASGTRTIAAGTTRDIFSVTVNGDLNLEPDETFKIEVTPVTGLRDAAPDTGTATILNDDARPNLHLTIDSAVREGNSGTKPLTFRLELLDAATGNVLDLANAPNVPVPFWWRTEGRTATTADRDYAGQAGRWDTIPAGQVRKSLSVGINGDTRYEPDEFFRIRVDTIRTAQAVGTRVIDTARILNDDDMPTVVVLDTSVQEPAVYGAVANMVFRVRLSAAAGVPVRVGYETVPNTARGTVDFAVEPWDYLESDSGAFVEFPADTVYRTISVPVYGDTLYEKNQDFYLQLLNSTNSVISDNRATGVIVDADTAPAIRISDAPAVNEGAKANFSISVERPAEAVISFRLRTRDGTARAPGDFRGLDTVVSMPIYSRSLQIA